MRLIFYSHWGNGDLVESRKFVIAFMRMMGLSKCYYAYKPEYHGSFEDLPEIEWTPLTHDMNPGRSITRRGDTLLVNTWVGRGHDQKMNGYVLQPGVGCVLERIAQMWNDMSLEAGMGDLPGVLQDYLPEINYQFVFIAPMLKMFIEETRGRKIVLFCNGKTTSHQAPVFEYHDMLDYLPRDKGIVYLFTQRVPMAMPTENQYFTDVLTGRGQGIIPGHPNWDLTAISYLSLWCDVIVGRCSGPQMYASVKRNWDDPTKTLVCLTHTRNGASFVRYPESLGLKMRVLWSPATNAKDAAEVIKPLLA